MSEPVLDKLLSHPLARQTAARVKRHRRWLYGLATLFVLFGLLGYFWLPGFAKGKVEALLTEKLHRPVSIERIDIRPYSLEATIYGFRIGEREGEGDGALLKFDSLYLNLSSTSIMRAGPVVSAVTLIGPQVHLARHPDGKLSIADLIEEFSQQPKSDTPLHFSVSNIQVEGGRIDFDDQLKHGHQQVSDISLGIPFVASFESAEEVWVQPKFRARINDGSLVAIDGRMRPFADHREAVVDIKLDGFDLTGVDEYAPPLGGIQLKSALVDTQLEVSFGQVESKAADIRVSGDVSLRKFELANKGKLPWNLRGDRLTLNLKNVDAMLRSPLDMALAGEKIRFQQDDKPEMVVNTLAVSDLKVDPAGKGAALNLAATINGKGSLKAEGRLGWTPVSADFKIDAEQVDIVALQRMLVDRRDLLITKGAASFKGTVKAAGEPLNVAVNGDASVDDFNMLDTGTNEDLLRWRSLAVSGVAANTHPLDVSIKSIAQSDFFARVVIMPDGTLRLKDVMADGDKPPVAAAAATTEKPAAPQVEQQADQQADKKVQKTPTGTVTTAEVAPARAPLPVRIDEAIFKNGNIIFNDRFIKPNYRANLTQLSGRVGPLYPGKPGEVAIKGTVNRSAPLALTGKVDPFGKELYIDLRATAKGIDLPGFSPYSSRYIGYEIAKGKLSVDLRYYIEKGQLRAENSIFLDQFTLGDKVDSPNAVSLPVGLAVSLLKNSRGEIDINLPISGSLNDPEFSIGGLIVKVFFNLLSKAVTAPFALLGSMFGGGADLSYAEFAPGYARLTPEAEKNLDAIAKAMADRPALKIEITGVANAATDRDGLKQATLERRIKAQKLADLARQGKSGGSVSDVEVTAAEYPKYLEMAYKAEKFDKPRNLIGMTKSLPPAEMERLMLANLPAGDDELRALAERRARNAYETLTAKGVPGERTFVVQPRVDAVAEDKKPGGRVEFSLR